MGHRQWVVRERVQGELAESRVAAVRGRGNSDTSYFIASLCNLSPCIMFIENFLTLGGSALEFSKT